MVTLAAFYFVIFSRTLIGVVLLAAGALKLPVPAEFAKVIAGFKLLPRAFHRPIAYVLPVLECMVGAAVLLSIGSSYERITRWVSVPASAIFVMFGMAVGINLLRGRRDISCGCFGIRESDKISWELVWRNLLLATLALFAFSRTPTGVLVYNASDRTMDAILLGFSTLLGWLLIRAIFQMRRFGRTAQV
jgi:hypothetical protein